LPVLLAFLQNLADRPNRMGAQVQGKGKKSSTLRLRVEPKPDGQKRVSDRLFFADL
jgi:hypothetical protein